VRPQDRIGREVNLTDGQKRYWDANSHLVFRGAFSERASQLSLWVDEVAGWPEDTSKWLTYYEMSDPAKLSRIENFAPYA